MKMPTSCTMRTSYQELEQLNKTDLSSFCITTVLTRRVCVMFEKMSHDSPEIIKNFAGVGPALDTSLRGLHLLCSDESSP